MGRASRRFVTEFGRTIWTFHNAAQTVLGVLSLLASTVMGWRFGVAWGLATLASSLLLVSVETGRRLAAELERREVVGGVGLTHPLSEAERGLLQRLGPLIERGGLLNARGGDGFDTQSYKAEAESWTADVLAALADFPDYREHVAAAQSRMPMMAFNQASQALATRLKVLQFIYEQLAGRASLDR